MGSPNNEVTSSYLQNDDLWKLWQDHGISETTILNVEFQFISKEKEAASGLAKLLEQRGYETKLGTIRKGLFNKFWDINLTMPSQTWTLEKLNLEAKEFHKLALDHGCLIDGIGAMMPEKP